jgi:hypothetical protein
MEPGGCSTSSRTRKHWRSIPTAPGPTSSPSCGTTPGSSIASILSTRAHQPQHRQGDVDFGWLEDELRPLGFLVALLTRDPTTFGAARADRLRVSGKPAQYDDLGVFVREQDLFRRLGEETTLPLSEFDISDRDVYRVAGRIADWLEESGGLWMADG